jgi:hypothetical protein
VSWIPYVSVERFDVVAVWVEEERGVVARGVLAIARRPVRAEAGPDACPVERIDLIPRLATKQRCRSVVGGCRSTTATRVKHIKRSVSESSDHEGIPIGSRTVV